MKSSDPFSGGYAAAYDALNEDKDYAVECNFLERIFERFGNRKVHTVLDLGCGTGGHALILGANGHDVVGVDRSADMIRIAGGKLAAATDSTLRKRVRFHVGDVVTSRVATQFDAAIMMFAVLGYVSEMTQLGKLLASVRAQLRTGGLFAADFWYGPAVLTQRPGDRVRVIDHPGRTIVRATHTELDTFTQVATVRFELFDWVNETKLARSDEFHMMRYFFAQELHLLCQAAGFSIRHICRFPDLAARVDESTWNAAFIAEAIER
jgi:SAM-dependent methyltransferase